MATTEIRVRGYHLDGYGHVNNARYLEFLEEARWAFFEQHGLLALLGDIQMVVARIDIRYRHGATDGDLLAITSRPHSIQPRRITLTQHIRLAGSGQICAQAEITLVPAQQGRLASLSPELQQHLQLIEHP